MSPFSLVLAFFLVVAWVLRVEAAGRRIVSLAPSVTETLFAIGVGAEVVGVSEFCDYPPAVKKIDRMGSYLKPNVEVIVAHRPDVVIAVPSPGNREAIENLERLGARVLVVGEGPRLADVFDSIRRIAAEAGQVTEGEKVVAEIEAKRERVRKRLVGSTPRKAIFVLQRRPLMVVGEGTLLDELLMLAGGENLARGMGPWPQLSVEYLVRAAPEVVLDAAQGMESKPDLSFYQGLGLEAARKGRLHVMVLDEVVRPGPRLGLGLEKLAAYLHPELFEEAKP